MAKSAPREARRFRKHRRARGKHVERPTASALVSLDAGRSLVPGSLRRGEIRASPARHAPARRPPRSNNVAIAALVLTLNSDIRAEARADREAFRAEARAERSANQAAREAIRAEGRADREAIRAEGRADREAIRAEGRADREAFEKHITRLTQEQSRLTGIVDQMRTAGR